MTNTPTPEMSPEDIRRIRENLGLTQVRAGEILGGGPRAFAKYESGAIKPAASIANLLRLLERSPRELKTLTGAKVVPLDSMTHRPFDVSADHVRALTPKKFTLLVEKLLAAEALSGGLPMDGIHVAAQITVGDGGEDARIEWRDGPERTAFLPSRLTQFQMKASPVSPRGAAREVLTQSGEIKPMVKAVLGASGSYVMLVAHPAVKQSMAKHERAIRDLLTKTGLPFRDEQIGVRDAAQIALWVNSYPSVAAWLLEQTQPGLTGPFRDWTHWAGRQEHDSSPWVDDPRLEPFRTELRALIALPRGTARVVGPSGVGKSRLALEALGPDAIEESSHLALSSLILYGLESEIGSSTLKAAVQNLADAGIRAIIIIDRCSIETHEDLAGMVRRVGSQLSLVTIDHEYDVHHAPPGTLNIGRADRGVVEGIVHNVLPGIGKVEEERVARFSSGFPRAAQLIAESWEGSLVAASNDALVDRVILGRRASENGQLRKTAMLLSVFGLVGAKPPIDTDLAHLASLPGAPHADELRASLEDMLRRGVAQARGRLVSLQPLPIAQLLAERQWRQWGQGTWDLVLADLPPVELRVRAARQLALLNREKLAIDVVRSVCRVSGPFSSVETISEPGIAETLSFLSEVDAAAVADILEHVLGQLERDQLLDINGNVRRSLVEALEKIAFLEGTFEQGARILLALAGAENETWSNNATGSFKNLFSPLGGSTAAGPAARLQLLDEVISRGSEHLMPIVVEALLEGACTNGGFRVIGAEHHGSRPALKPWMPTYWHEAWDYVRECLTRLAHWATRLDTVGAQAKVGLGREFRSLVSYGLLEDIERICAIVSEAGSYWPEALDSLGDVLKYDSGALKDGEEERVRALIEKLRPVDVDSRVRFLVTEMPWDYPVDQDLEFQERDRRQLADIDALAVELLASPEQLLRIIFDLSRGDQRMSAAFGRSIATRAKDPVAWLGPVSDAYARVPADERNTGLLGGFLGGLAASHSESVSTFKHEAATSPTFAPTLPFVCTCVGLTASDVPLAVVAMRAGLLPPARLRSWTLGGVLGRFPPDVLAPLFDVLFDMENDAYSIALDLLAMYAHGDQDRLEGLRPQLRKAASKAGRRPRNPRFQMDRHRFKEIMGWMLDKGREDPDAAWIALTLARQIGGAEEEFHQDLVKPLLPRLLRDFPEMVWPIFGEKIVGDRRNAWKIELLLGDNHAFGVKKPAILELPEEALFAWCHAHPEVAPAFAAALLPVLTSRDPNDATRAIHPKMERLLDEFGDRTDTLRALTRNMHTFGWSGSLTEYFALYDMPLRAIENHPHGAVRQWVKKTRLELRDHIDAVRDEEEERAANWGE